MPNSLDDPFGLGLKQDALHQSPVSMQPVPKPAPKPATSIGLAEFPSEDLQTIIAIAVDAGIIQADIPTAEAVAQIESACAPLKKNGEVYLDLSRARLALRFLILRSNGMRTKEALLASGLKDWMAVGILKCHNRAFRACYQVANDRYLGAVNPSVVDSLVDAAINGDTVLKMKDGETVSAAHRANVRAQELVLRATDPRFRDADKGNAPAGGVTYNIGSINVAQLPAAGAGVPALPGAETIQIDGEKCGFGADKASVRIGNHA